MKNIIFDWDGTLARTMDLWLAGYQGALDRRGLNFEPAQIAAEFFFDHHLVQGRHPNLDFGTVVNEARTHVMQGCDALDLYENARHTLLHLHSRRKVLGLVTSSQRAVLDAGLSLHSLSGFFTSTICGDDGYGHKPDPLPFVTTLERMGATAEETLVIGDSHADILAGKAVGCRTCLFAPSENGIFHNYERLRELKPDIEIAHLPTLLEHV